MLLTKKLIFTSLLMGGVFLFLPTSGFAKTIYIDFSASTNGSGTESSPYNNAGSFNTNFAAGDMVYFAGTTTSTDVGINDKDGTAANPSIFSQWSGRTQATFSPPSGHGFNVVNSDYVQISGISFSAVEGSGLFINGGSNITVSNVTAYSSTGTSILISGASTVSVSNATVTNAGGGIRVQGTTSGVTISGNTVTGLTSTSGGNGISVSAGTSTDLIISNNTFASNRVSGISIGGGITVTNLTISGNTIHSNSVNGIDIQPTSTSTSVTIDRNKIYNHTTDASNSGVGILSSSPSAVITNNLVYRNRIGMSFLASGSASAGASGTIMRNNTLYQNTTTNVSFSETSNGTLTGFTGENNVMVTATDSAIYKASNGNGAEFTSLDYNRYYLVGSNAKMLTNATTFDAWKTAMQADANSTEGDPSFTATTSGSEDFTPAAGSLLIDGGKPTSTTPTTDYAGNTRPWTSGTGSAGRYDIGAYEKQNLLGSTGVSLAGVSSRDSATGVYTNTLTIMDGTNTSNVYYAITTDGGTTWLNGSGATATTPTYSTSKTWTHTSLTSGTFYSYQLRIAYGSTVTTYLGLMTAVVVSTQPTGVTAVSGKGGTATISWNAVIGAATYELSYGRTALAEDAVVTGMTKTTRELKKLVRGKHYFVKVRGMTSAGGAGTWSEIVHFETRFPTLGITLSRSDGMSNRVWIYGIDGKQIKSFEAFPTSKNAQMMVRSLDADGDGDVEIAVARYDEGGLSTIRLFDDKGKLVASTNTHSKEIKNGISIAAGDFNFDGKDELAAIPYKGKAELRIYYYDSATKKFKQLSVKQVFPESHKGGARVFSADLNGDYKDDLIVTRPGRKDLKSYTIDSENKFVEIAELTIPIKGSQLATGDADGDGDDEIAVVSNEFAGDSKIRLYSLNDKGKFGLLVEKRPYPASVKGSFSIRMGDLNGEGRAEVLIVPGPDNVGNLRVLSYDPDAAKVNKRFVEIDGELVGTDDELQGKRIGVMDLDNSGKSEIVVASITKDPTIYIYHLNSKGKISLVKKFNPLDKGAESGFDLGEESL